MAKVTLTKTRQHTIVGEGLALGCLAVGIEGLSNNKLTIDRAFRFAWVRWEYSKRFPGLNAGPRFDDILAILEKSSGRTGKPVAAFRAEPGWGFVPYLTATVSNVTEAGARLEETSGIPLTAWKALAELTATGLVQA
ncbi:hypothetical protein GCM10022198_20890 [Klugiella xanthotipulae]|uniref:Uncharacterized protein n=1 Tax=Klugiella xanthotipulae TaxID=244735 RepID=A0A543HXV4_9MICO|nr:hypothetical protein [Klugiella xanthotipulae]TQM63176.1 hypothetical protein FB466_1430 [Klugiella xanthotipulae]